MSMTMIAKRCRLALAAAPLVGVLAVQAAPPHEHGSARVDVAVEGNKLTIELESPLDGLLGFEHAPRDGAERQAVDKMLATLRAADQLFRPDPAAQCTLANVELESAVLKLGEESSAKQDDGHGDLDGEFEFRCKTAPGFVEIGLFAAFPRLARIDVQTATPQGQRKLTLRPPAQRVELRR